MRLTEEFDPPTTWVYAVGVAIRTVDLEGVPEDQAKVIEDQVRYWRAEAAKKAKPTAQLPRWRGSVIGRLTREEIYEDDE